MVDFMHNQFQWLGNLVTQNWWGDLWLSEGFATLYDSFDTDLRKEMVGLIIVNLMKTQLKGNIVLQTRFALLKEDLLPTTHPISSVVKRVGGADAIFDRITYHKVFLILKS